MLAIIPTSLRDMPGRWRSLVRERRQLTSVDPAADALELAAKELEQAIDAAQDESRLLTTTEYAKVRRVGAGTVRKWCLRGELPGATLSEANAWLIPSTASRKAKR